MPRLQAQRHSLRSSSTTQRFFLSWQSTCVDWLPNEVLRHACASILLLSTGILFAQPRESTTAAQFDTTEAPPQSTQLEQLYDALYRLPLAAGLASILALRPRRRGTPPRQPSVVQTQIILAIVGAVVMIIVGTSLARAFGIVGAAGLVRYRAKIADPKDAGVMLSTLAIGLASGVGIWMLAVFSTVFVLAVLWVIESFEKAKAAFDLKVEAKDPAALRPKIEDLLTAQPSRVLDADDLERGGCLRGAAADRQETGPAVERDPQDRPGERDRRGVEEER